METGEGGGGDGGDQGVEEVNVVVGEQAAAFEQGAKEGVREVAYRAGDDEDQECLAVRYDWGVLVGWERDDGEDGRRRGRDDEEDGRDEGRPDDPEKQSFQADDTIQAAFVGL